MMRVFRCQWTTRHCERGIARSSAEHVKFGLVGPEELQTHYGELLVFLEAEFGLVRTAEILNEFAKGCTAGGC